MERNTMSQHDFDAWNYREGTDVSTRQDDLAGFRVHATDGHIGKIDAATREVDGSYVVVDTGPWIFGRKVLLPAGTIERVDWDEKDVYVDRTKDEIKDSPELRDEDRLEGSDTAVNDEYRGRLSDYYGERPGGPGDGARV
jgi:hypothetical protein